MGPPAGRRRQPVGYLQVARAEGEGQAGRGRATRAALASPVSPTSRRRRDARRGVLHARRGRARRAQQRRPADGCRHYLRGEGGGEGDHQAHALRRQGGTECRRQLSAHGVAHQEEGSPRVEAPQLVRGAHSKQKLPSTDRRVGGRKLAAKVGGVHHHAGVRGRSIATFLCVLRRQLCSDGARLRRRPAAAGQKQQRRGTGVGVLGRE